MIEVQVCDGSCEVGRRKRVGRTVFTVEQATSKVEQLDRISVEALLAAELPDDLLNWAREQDKGVCQSAKSTREWIKSQPDQATYFTQVYAQIVLGFVLQIEALVPLGKGKDQFGNSALRARQILELPSLTVDEMSIGWFLTVSRVVYGPLRFQLRGAPPYQDQQLLNKLDRIVGLPQLEPHGSLVDVLRAAALRLKTEVPRMMNAADAKKVMNQLAIDLRYLAFPELQ